jgi:hypothetical protein
MVGHPGAASMTTVAFYDTKPYDRQFMVAAATDVIHWVFHEFRLTAETAATARGADAVCVFVNDRLDRACLEELAGCGIRHVALRCAGFNNVDLVAAGRLGFVVTRVPAYSPHAVAEHTVALVLTLNRRIHRAYNRVREQNFSLSGLVGFDLHGKTCGIVGTGRIGRVTAEIFRGFGMRVDPFTNTLARHEGLDFTAMQGTPILATADGTVSRSGWEDTYGNIVEITHAEGFMTRYAHISTRRVTEGQRVKRGDRIAEVGSTGRSTGPHLHYEVFHQGHVINPLQVLPHLGGDKILVTAK